MVKILDSGKKVTERDNNASTEFLLLMREQPDVSPEFLAQLSTVCERMLNSGWYGESTCNLYVTVCSELIDHKSLWLLIADQCDDFAANNRITLEYLRTVQAFSLNSVTSDRVVSLISSMNELLTGLKAEAPASIINAIKTASTVFSETGTPRFWVAATHRFSSESTDIFRQFLSLSLPYLTLFDKNRYSLQDGDYWQWLTTVCNVNANVAIAFMEAASCFGPELPAEPLFIDFLTTIAADEEGAVQLIELAGDNWDPDILQKSLPFVIRLAEIDSESLKYLLILTKEKSLDLPALEPWLNQGLCAASDNKLTGRAWFSLESLNSKNAFKLCRGSVHLEDCNQLLQLICEGLGGRVFSVAPVEMGSWVLDNFSESIHLPMEVSFRNNYEENFSLYRLMILYQVAFWESGIADFINRTDKESIASFVTHVENRQLALDLVNIIVPVYIERFMLKRYPGIRNDLLLWQRYYRTDRSWTAAVSGIDSLLEDSLYLDSVEFRDTEQRNRIIISGLSGTDLSITDSPNTDPPGSELSIADRSKKIPENEKKSERLYSEFLLAEISTDGTKLVKVDFLSILSALKSAYLAFENEGSAGSIGMIFYRGKLAIDLALLSVRMELVKEEVDKVKSDDDASGVSDLLNPENISVEELRQGDLDDAMGQFLTDVEGKLSEDEFDDESLKKKAEALREKFSIEHGTPKKQAKIFTYDEWDYQIRDYRKDWCILHEQVLESKSEQFVAETLSQHSDLLRQIRKQLQMLKPELHRKVRGLSDGEDIHHDDAIEAMVDLRSGVSPNENIYVQRLKAERDVSTLFLLDMSASTDESLELFKAQRNPDANLPAGEAVPAISKDKKEPKETDHIDYLMDAYDSSLKPSKPKETYRIIDIERQSVVLMAEALEELGDSYAISGFSGYGRDRVDYFQCKAFEERYDATVKGRIEAVSPRQSTRMGPSIRHGIQQLLKTESKVKAMIIISDGYPQDFDYGKDRTSKVYGIEDTARALQEAKREGIHTFCLTVDPAGHDYLKDMCPDNQYMIIQDIEELPKELSRVYSALTS